MTNGPITLNQRKIASVDSVRLGNFVILNVNTKLC